MKTCNHNTGRLNLDRIAFYGRTAEEYRQYFGVTAQAAKGKRLLDCAAGSASFAAELGAMGVEVTACDPQYEKGGVKLANKGKCDIEYMLEQMKKADGQFDWSYYGDLENRAAYASRSLKTFVADLKNHPERYVAGSLPNLPFDDDSFDLVLCGHFLFVYDGMLDADFHLAAVRELLRVARGEVRIYPLLKANGQESLAVAKVILAMEKEGYRTRLLPSGFEFVKGADTIMSICRAD